MRAYTSIGDSLQAYMETQQAQEQQAGGGGAGAGAGGTANGSPGGGPASALPAAEERVASRCYSKRPCNFAVTGEAGETIKDIRARLGTGKPARMPTLAAAEGAARWVSELTGRTFVAEEVRHA